jgi:hypothetical protein
MRQVLGRYSLQLDDRPRLTDGDDDDNNDSDTDPLQRDYRSRAHALRKKASMRRALMEAVLPTKTQEVVHNVTTRLRRSSIYKQYERAKLRTKQAEKHHGWMQVAFEYGFYVLLASFVYFVLVGLPLWNGVVYYTYIVFQNNFILVGGWAIVTGIAFMYAFGPLFMLFEKDPPMPVPAGEEERSSSAASESNSADVERGAKEKSGDVRPGAHDTALIIPCYKSAKIIGPTLQAALKVFPARNIYVIANGNSEKPLDNTEEVCAEYKVNVSVSFCLYLLPLFPLPLAPFLPFVHPSIQPASQPIKRA